MSPVIFIDLDETLIQAIPMARGAVGHKRKPVRVHDQTYKVALRPLAPQMLADCRGLAPTILLTNSDYHYALSMNYAFELGFGINEIIAREQIWQTSNMALVDENIRLRKWEAFQPYNPLGILIDNLPHKDTHSLIKKTFLGIPWERYLCIREFRGQDPDKFVFEWSRLLETTKQLLKHNG